MKESVIASSHHFYVTFFDSPDIKSVSSLINLFTDKMNIEPVVQKNKNQLHIQLLINERYGNERVLIGNQVKRGEKIYYWYDFYIGKLDTEEKKIFFICYPYNRMKHYLEDIFFENEITNVYHKPVVKTVLEYMKESDRSEATRLDEGFSAQITKYTAQIKNSLESNRVNIIGQNPLNSKVFEILNKKGLGLTIKTTSLKLRCDKLDVGHIDLAFDRLGNFRFWIRRDAADIAIPMIPFAFDFFKNIDAIIEDEFISSQTLLEDD